MDEEKERQKEAIRKLGQETLAQHQKNMKEVDEKASKMLENIHEVMLETQKMVAQWTEQVNDRQQSKPSHLHLVPPIEKTDEDTKSATSKEPNATPEDHS